MQSNPKVWNAKDALTKQGIERLFNGHPWLFKGNLKANYLESLGVDPSLVALGEHWFLYSPQSEICLRRLGPSERFWPADGMARERTTITHPEIFKNNFWDVLYEHFLWLWDHKKKALGSDESCFRWIFSENDFVPGLVVDVFHDVLSVQLLSAPVEHFWPVIGDLLKAICSEKTGKTPIILDLRDAPTRKKEGLAIVPRQESGIDHSGYRLWNGMTWWMRPGQAQKTGAFLDQRNNHLDCAQWATTYKVRQAWDVCCFEGGFGLHLAKRGIETLGVDLSQSALETLDRNRIKNELSPQSLKAIEANAFDWLRDKFDSKEKTDLIVLDPPSFVKSKRDKESALRGFKELNLRSLHCLKPGGLLVTCSCSHHISRTDYESMLRRAAHDARRGIKVLQVSGPAPDHAPQISFPEGEYLQAWYLEVQ